MNCIRFEAKHRELKQYTNNTTSRKNIALSIAIKIQLKSAYKIMFQNGLQHKLICKKMHKLNEQQVTDFGLEKNTNYFQTSTVSYKGTIYKTNFYFSTPNPSVKLFQIVNIVVDTNENEFFICQEYNILGFDNHFQSYEVGEAIGTLLTVNIKTLRAPPIHTHIVNMKTYFRNKIL